MRFTSFLNTNNVDRELQIVDEGDSFPDECYVTVTLRTLKLGASRIGFKKFYGAVISTVQVEEGHQVTRLVTPGELGLDDVDASTLNRILMRDQIIADRIAYKGGLFGIKFVLVAMQSADLSGPYLSLAGSVLNAFAPGFTSLTGPLKEATTKVWEQVTAGHCQIQVGTFLQSNEPKSCTIIITDREASTNGNISMDKNGYLRCDGENMSASYAVLEVHFGSKKLNWRTIPELASAYKILDEKVRSGVRGDIEKALTFFSLTVKLSPDLISLDASRVVSEVKAQIDSILQGGPVSRSENVELLSLDKINIY